MSAAVALLAKCREHGISLRPGEGGRLKVSPPPERLPGQIVAELKFHRQEILALLTVSSPRPEVPASPPDYHTLYEAMTCQFPEDMPLVDAWLCEHHPVLWRRMRELDDDLTHMEQKRGPEAMYRTALEELISVCQQGKRLRVCTWRALPIRAEVLGGELVWVVKDEEQARAVMGDGKAVYSTEEFAVLKTKTPEQIRDVHTAKLAFPGCRVVQ